MEKPITYLVLLVALSISSGISFAQISPWQRSTEWKLYNTGGRKFYRINPDSLKVLPSHALNDDTMRSFLIRSEPLNDKPLWMGAYVTSCIIDHKQRKIDISTYGTFFFDESDGKLYSIPSDMQQDWLRYLSASTGDLPTTK